MARRRNDGSEAAVVFLLLLAMALVLSLGAALLYLPLRKYPSNNPGKGLGILGIVIVFVGIGVLVYQASNAGPDSSPLSATSLAGWFPTCLGFAIYIFGLGRAGNYHLHVLAANDEIRSLESDGSVSESKLLEAAQEICRKRSLLASDAQAALSNATRIRSIRMIESGELPTTSPAEGMFLKPGETCHARFLAVEYYEDVSGTRRTAAGGAVYWKVADGITLRPSAYSAQSMPVSELRKTDLGSLVITDRRVIFHGQRHVKETMLDRIEGLSPYENGFQIQTGGKSKREVFSMPILDVHLATTLISRLVIKA
jgi:hypothetical protein